MPALAASNVSGDKIAFLNHLRYNFFEHTKGASEII